MHLYSLKVDGGHMVSNGIKSMMKGTIGGRFQHDKQTTQTNCLLY
jgi:hypothetical protein